MFNQEQLAAIAAAVSILQQSMQSNPTNSTPQNASSTPNATTSSSTNNGNNQLAAIQQQLAEAAAAAVAASQAHSHMNQNHHNHHQQQQQQHQQQQHQQHHHLQQQHSQLSDVNFDHRQQQQQQSHLDGLTSMAALKAALPIESEHHMQHLPTRHSVGVAPGPQATTTPITSTSQQNHLLNQLRQQYNRSDLSVSQPSSHYPAQLQLDEQQQQILLNHLRVLQQPAQDSHHLNNILPEFNHQHHQEHQGLLDQYQSRLRDLQQLSNLHLSAPLSPNRPQAPMAPMEQRHQPLQQQQNQLKPEHDQQQATVNNQASTAAKPSRPISYSAIVAKSAGLNSSANNNINQNTHTNVTTSSLNNDNVMSGTNSNNIVSQNKFRNMTAMNNTFGDGSNHVNSSSNSSSPFSGSSNNHSIAVNPESMSKYNNAKGTSSINGHASRATTQQQQHFASSNSIVRNALNNHVANNTNIDIFNTNSHTGSSLAHTNGSSLLKRNSNNLLSLEPSLDGYHTDYPISPAQQLFNQQNNSFRHSQVPNPTYNQQNQNNNHSSFNTDIVFNTNSRDKGTPTYGRATNLLGFMGLYVGNLSPDLSKEQLEKLFSKYGEPVKAHRLIRSPVAFIKYENTESPRAAIDDLYGLLLPELTLNPDQPLKLHFDRNDAQLKANYRPTELPKEDNGECYGWRTTVCKRGKSCPKKHIPINRGIDFQMWMIKSNSTSTTGATTSTVTPTLAS